MNLKEFSKLIINDSEIEVEGITLNSNKGKIKIYIATSKNYDKFDKMFSNLFLDKNDISYGIVKED